ncbi:hypothetical protein D3C76_1404350 [compost metagenome]
MTAMDEDCMSFSGGVGKATMAAGMSGFVFLKQSNLVLASASVFPPMSCVKCLSSIGISAPTLNTLSTRCVVSLALAETAMTAITKTFDR